MFLILGQINKVGFNITGAITTIDQVLIIIDPTFQQLTNYVEKIRVDKLYKQYFL